MSHHRHYQTANNKQSSSFTSEKQCVSGALCLQPVSLSVNGTCATKTYDR